MVHEASEKLSRISGKLFANFQLSNFGAKIDEAEVFGCIRPTNMPLVIKAASAETGSPFHVIDVMLSGATTISLTPVCRSPRNASSDPKMLALRQRYGPPISTEVFVPTCQ